MSFSEVVKNRSFRFSLTSLLVVTLCICCFLAGDKFALSKRFQRFDPITAVRYPIDNLGVKDAEALVSRVKREISPATWDDVGGNCVCKLEQPIGGTKRYLVVGAHSNVHQEVRRFLVASNAMTFATAGAAGPTNIVAIVDGVPVFQ